MWPEACATLMHVAAGDARPGRGKGANVVWHHCSGMGHCVKDCPAPEHSVGKHLGERRARRRCEGQRQQARRQGLQGQGLLRQRHAEGEGSSDVEAHGQGKGEYGNPWGSQSMQKLGICSMSCMHGAYYGTTASDWIDEWARGPWVPPGTGGAMGFSV